MGTPRWARVAFLVALWGMSFPAIKLALNSAPPLLLVSAEMLLTGLALTAWVFTRQEPPGLAGKWRIVLISALFNVVLLEGLSTLAIAYLSAGVGAVLLYLQPVFVAALARRWLGEALSLRKIVGLALAFGGVVTLSTMQIHGRLPLIGVIVGAASGLGWAIGTVYVKRVGFQVPLASLVAAQFLVGGVVLVSAAVAIERVSLIQWNAVLIACVVYVVVSLALGWILWFDLLARGQASQVSAYVFWVPIVAFIGGVAFLGERLTISVVLGAVAIVAGIYLTTRETASLSSSNLSTH